MSRIKGIHPWFDMPEIHEIERYCGAGQYDYVSWSEKSLQAMKDANFRNSTDIRFLFGPTIHSISDIERSHLIKLFQKWMARTGLEKLGTDFILAIDIGLFRKTIRIENSRKSLIVASEKNSSLEQWQTISKVFLRVPIILSETEIAIKGGLQNIAEEDFRRSKISRCLTDYSIPKGQRIDPDFPVLTIDNITFRNLET